MCIEKECGTSATEGVVIRDRFHLILEWTKAGITRTLRVYDPSGVILLSPALVDVLVFTAEAAQQALIDEAKKSRKPAAPAA